RTAVVGRTLSARIVMACICALALSISGCSSSSSDKPAEPPPLTEANFAKRMHKAHVKAGSAQIIQHRKLASKDIEVQGELQVATKPQDTRVKITGEAFSSGLD